MNSLQLHTKVLRWYKNNARSLPWRRTKNPYRILLSEIMAQQTQISRVISFYNAWLRKFPSLSALAKASKADVLRQWSGLGYNNRALRLHALAKEVTTQRNGKLPRNVRELQQFPGVGKYTAHAVACLAFGDRVAVVDVNVRRIFSRMFWKARAASDMKPETEIWNLAEKYLPQRNTPDWNQALMDIGSQICTARNPQCALCPLKTVCASAFAKAFSQKPHNEKRVEPSFKGIPRRIYRGRILKALHDKRLTSEQIGKRVVEHFHLRDLRWIESVLEKMASDELIALRGVGARKKVSIAR